MGSGWGQSRTRDAPAQRATRPWGHGHESRGLSPWGLPHRCGTWTVAYGTFVTHGAAELEEWLARGPRLLSAGRYAGFFARGGVLPSCQGNAER
jgi:hypothetical protein